MSYSEDTLVSRNPANEKELKISDLATKVIKIRVIIQNTVFFFLLNQNETKNAENLLQEFLETLKSADVLPNDWEVVFPDCPIEANFASEGLFSVTGYCPKRIFNL